MEGESWNCKRELVSFSAMAAIELINVCLNTLYKAAAAKGLSQFVLITYSHAIGALFLLPFLIFFPRRAFPPFNMSILFKFVLLAVFGYSCSICSYKGIEYTSPTIASAITNLVPAFTFVFAVVFRMEALDFKSSKTRAKIIGTIVSISGALMTILYKGPVVLSSLNSTPPLSLEYSSQMPQENWVIGGFLLVTLCLFVSASFILQTKIVNSYPNELTVSILNSLFTSIIAAAIGFVVERKERAWELRTDMALLTVGLTGFLGPTFATAVHTWGLNMKGPVYVSIFRPFSICIAAALGFMFLGDDLYLGSVIGAIIILIGLYAVIWGKTNDHAYDCLATPSLASKTPLLLKS